MYVCVCMYDSYLYVCVCVCVFVLRSATSPRSLALATQKKKSKNANPNVCMHACMYVSLSVSRSSLLVVAFMVTVVVAVMMAVAVMMLHVLRVSQLHLHLVSEARLAVVDCLGLQVHGLQAQIQAHKTSAKAGQGNDARNQAKRSKPELHHPLGHTYPLDLEPRQICRSALLGCLPLPHVVPQHARSAQRSSGGGQGQRNAARTGGTVSRCREAGRLTMAECPPWSVPVEERTNAEVAEPADAEVAEPADAEAARCRA